MLARTWSAARSARIVVSFWRPASARRWPPARADPRRPRRPNILFAFSDDQSYPHASILGDPVVKTPAFDRVAREGVLFTHSFTACPSCTPSRMSVIKGRHMWQTGLGGVLYGTIDPRYTLFTHALEDAGYHLGYTGKGIAPGDPAAGGVTRPPLGRRIQQPSRPTIRPRASIRATTPRTSRRFSPIAKTGSRSFSGSAARSRIATTIRALAAARG